MDKPPVPSNRGNQNLENFVLDKTVGAASSDSQSQDRRASTSSFDRTWTFSTAVNAASESGATAATRATAVVVSLHCQQGSNSIDARNRIVLQLSQKQSPLKLRLLPSSKTFLTILNLSPQLFQTSLESTATHMLQCTAIHILQSTSLRINLSPADLELHHPLL
jgi:hypothetical protein